MHYGYSPKAEKLLKDDSKIDVSYVVKDGQGKCEIHKGDYKISKLYHVLAFKDYPIFYVVNKLRDNDTKEKPPVYEDFDYRKEDRGEIDLHYRPDIFKAFEENTPIFGMNTGKLQNRRVNEMIPLIIDDFCSEKPTFQFSLAVEDEVVISMLQENDKETRTEKEIFKDAVNKKALYLEMPEYDTDSEYDILFVDRIPFEPDVKTVSGKGKKLILIPFGLSIYGILEQKRNISMDDFLERVKDEEHNSNFRGCVDWVMKYSEKGKNSERKDVEEAYIRFCKKIYDYSKFGRKDGL